MKMLAINRRTVALIMVLLPLLLVFGYVVARSGPLAPVPVTVVEVKKQAITPALFGIGTVEARYRYRLGPTMTGRPVDMDEKISANQAAVKRAAASVAAAEARVKDFIAREKYARAQAKRYKRLVTERNVSKEGSRRSERSGVSGCEGWSGGRAGGLEGHAAGVRAEYEGLLRQRSNLRLVAPVEGVIAGRYIEPGSTVMAGQPVLEIIDPKSIWVSVRFNQLQSDGLAKDLPATVVLRSRSDQPVSGKVARVELLADPVTEETLAKVAFDRLPEPFPPLGELAEVTVSLPRLDATLVVPNASIKRVNGQSGVWVVENDSLRFAPVEIGVSDLDGRVQVIRGLEPGDKVVLYSKKELTANSRISITDQLLEGA